MLQHRSQNSNSSLVGNCRSYGSARLAQSLLAAGLFDEISLVIAPVIVGCGRRLFPDGGTPAGLRLADIDTTPGGLTLQTFDWTGLPDYATYSGVSDIA